MHRRLFRFAATPLGAVLYMILRSTVLFSPIFPSTILLSLLEDSGEPRWPLVHANVHSYKKCYDTRSRLRRKRHI
jgi:hypothetical protein